MLPPASWTSAHKLCWLKETSMPVTRPKRQRITFRTAWKGQQQCLAGCVWQMVQKLGAHLFSFVCLFSFWLTQRQPARRHCFVKLAGAVSGGFFLFCGVSLSGRTNVSATSSSLEIPQLDLSRGYTYECLIDSLMSRTGLPEFDNYYI